MPVVQAYGPLIIMIFILAAVIDFVFFGRQINRKVAAKFPKGDPTGQPSKGFALGCYGFNRACLIRRDSQRTAMANMVAGSHTKAEPMKLSRLAKSVRGPDASR